MSKLPFIFLPLFHIKFVYKLNFKAMKNLVYFSLLLAFVFVVCCKNEVKKEEVVKQETTQEQNSDYLINAVLWVQSSAEYRACCYQAFNYAKIALGNNLKAAKKDKPAAVVFDLDETLLDNSYYEVYLIENKMSYTPESWKEWSEKECATAIPGAVEFVNYVSSLGVEVVYISNRLESEKEVTIRNMKKLGFPDVKDENLYFMNESKGSNKVERRNAVGEKYNIVLLVGDNLADFSGEYEKRGEDLGIGNVDNDKDLFGFYYVILPNPMYGKWESSLPKDKELSTIENKKKALIGYDKVCK